MISTALELLATNEAYAAATRWAPLMVEMFEYVAERAREEYRGAVLREIETTDRHSVGMNWVDVVEEIKELIRALPTRPEKGTKP